MEQGSEASKDARAEPMWERGRITCLLQITRIHKGVSFGMYEGGICKGRKRATWKELRSLGSGPDVASRVEILN